MALIEVIGQDRSTEQSRRLSTDYFTVSYCYSPSPTEGRVNEDCFLIKQFSDDSILMVVADGLGGHRGGAQASEIVTKAFAKLHANSSFSEVIDYIDQAHQDIEALKLGSGSTATGAFIKANKVRFFNAGDSPGFLISGHKQIRFQTIEHSPVGMAEFSGFIDSDEAKEHEKSHEIISALGLNPLYVSISGWMELNERDYVLLASDGLTSNFSIDQVSEHLTTADSGNCLDPMAAQIRDHMLAGGHPDDLTLLLYHK